MNGFLTSDFIAVVLHIRWSGPLKHHLLLPIILRESKIQPKLYFREKKK